MSTKQDLEEIQHRAQRECVNLRTSMEGRGCPEEEIQAKCQDILRRAQERVEGIREKTRIREK